MQEVINALNRDKVLSSCIIHGGLPSLLSSDENDLMGDFPNFHGKGEILEI